MLAPSREAAKRQILAGRVTVDGAPANKPGRLVATDQNIQILGPPPKFVSRSGVKLEAALDQFVIDPKGLICLDAGSSTGGFTDCLLQRQAAKIYAVDVGTNQLHERIRSADRVVVYEKTDIRKVTQQTLGEAVGLLVGDLSFISLRLVMPALAALVELECPLVLLVKPQFEAGRQEASKGKGIISDPAIWQRVLKEVISDAETHDVTFVNVMVSPITGTAGNIEFVVWFKRSESRASYSQNRIDEVVAEAEQTSYEQVST